MIYDLVVAGSLTKDIFVLTDRGKIFKTPKDKLAPAWLGFELGEKICANDVMESAGGMATNLPAGMKRLGLKTAFCGPVKAAVSVIVLDRKTGERIIFYQKSSGSIRLAPLARMRAKWLSVSSFTGSWNREAGLILAYIKREKAKLIVNPSTSMIREGCKNLKKLFASAEIVFLNRNEAIEIAFSEKTKTSDVKKLVKLLHKLGPKIVCLTDGAKGAYCSDGKNIVHAPVIKVKTVDVTGAGDAFAAGFLGLFLKGAAIERCLQAGIVNSASVVRCVGATKGMLTRKEILKALGKNTPRVSSL